MSVYEVGLRLRGKTVLVVGGGSIAGRRVPRLLAAGARVRLVAPEATTTLTDYAAAGELRWERREWRSGDGDDAWFVLAATDDPAVNAAVAAEAEAARTWCVRADDAEASDAWTLAQTAFDGVSVAVSASGDPRRAASIRDAIGAALHAGDLDAPRTRTAPRAGVALVGAGPGDADLITLRGLELLRRAEVVVSDRLAPQELLDMLGDDVEIVDAAKLPYGRHTTQEQINAVMVERALEGKFVVRLKGGDGFVFGRGAEELDACVEAGVPVEVVPGLSSSIAGPAAAGIPVTERGVVHDFTVATGHVPPGPQSKVNWEALGAGNGTVVLLMAVKNRGAIAEALIAGGRSPDAAVRIVENATTKNQTVRECVLSDLGVTEAHHPAVIVIGDVAARARTLPRTDRDR
ncbi:uroporphyrinogen-III C-methyltransferase [Glycomyces harbinensis]|uniref:Uroporphyrin-III C-methyltransferase / precorrin-2 dehydrogenase / sirohydrochlorin ferrochelatase n=1 Tax=Glycomyces harbinensis TaxID=58114 RepID=A0A1G7CAG5_9ACTN|nr:uroporphyrinogen-III C-methyltransferase [Glycomyces harbinensis]SDE35706.1 uroporphyrin-III C-methyltransferase / precorrin-2 dehydrogenase / sirohydrochlorin ferrochelatase [Glycomyces harbinensis]